MLSRFAVVVGEDLQPNERGVRRRSRIESAQEVFKLFAGTTEIQFANSPRNRGVHQDIPCRGRELGSPRQEDGNILRTGAKYVPRLEATRDPPTPKLGEPNCNFIPTPTDLEKAECPNSETRVIVLQTRLDGVKKCLYQQLRWQTGDGGV